MLNHKEIVDQYIEKYGQDLLQHDKELLYVILLNPESKLSEELIALHNNKPALKIIDDIISQKESDRFEERIKQICRLPYSKDIKNILHMQYWTQKCHFAAIDDIYHILKNFPHITTDLREGRPSNYYEHLILTNWELLERLFDAKDESSMKLLSQWDEYMLYRLIFFELINPLRKTIWLEPFIALVKKWLIEDELDEKYIELCDAFNSMDRLIEDNVFGMEEARHLTNKADVYLKRNRVQKLEKMEERLWAKRMSIVLDIIYLKQQLRTQSSLVRKYFNNSNIDNIIIGFFEINHTDSREKIKKMTNILQKKEIFLRSYFNWHLQVR